MADGMVGVAYLHVHTTDGMVGVIGSKAVTECSSPQPVQGRTRRYVNLVTLKHSNVHNPQPNLRPVPSRTPADPRAHPSILVRTFRRVHATETSGGSSSPP
jgi:hypothetical protein